MKMTELNSWFVLAVLSDPLITQLRVFVGVMQHITLLLRVNSAFCAPFWRLLRRSTGCYISLGDTPKAQELFDTIPSLLDKRKINGKDLPTEVLIRKKCMS